MSRSEDMLARARADDAVAAYERLTAADMTEVVGQETAKRALQIAAVGNHTVRLVGDALAIRHLKSVYDTIGGDIFSFVDRGADIVVIVPPTAVTDLLFAPPTDPSATMRERVERGRKVRPTLLNNSGGPALAANAEELLRLACERGMQREQAVKVGLSIAALEGRPYVERLHVAEALGYQKGDD